MTDGVTDGSGVERDKAMVAGRGRSIQDFMTDGSLAMLCDAAQRIVGAPVALRDRVGRLVAVSDTGIETRETAETRERADFSGFTAPIRVRSRTIGGLTLAAETALAPERRAEVEHFLTLLASIVGELCENDLELRRQVQRLGAMHRIASTLVAAPGLDETIRVGLEEARRALRADAGTLRLLDPSGRTLLPRGSAGLSEAYMREAGPLAADNALDRRILSGAVVAIEDFQSEQRVAHPQAVRSERLVSMISAALTFRGEALGVMRLYTRKRRRFTEDERDLLGSIAQQIATAVANARLQEREARDAAVREQVRVAGEVQGRMLPREIPRFERLDVAAACEASYDVGGDFYDLFERGGRLGVVIGDVVGKGVAAALLMANLHGSLRAYADQSGDPSEVIGATNRALCRASQTSEFATAFYGIVDPGSLRLLHCNAGHEPPLVVRVPEHRAPTAADVDALDVGGMVVGVDPSQRYQTGVYDLHPGDVVLAFSDGLSEALDFEGRLLGRARVRDELLALLGESPEASADRIVRHMRWAMRRHTGLAPQSDDTTIVALRVRR